MTDDGLDLSASAVRRMACDCDLIRVVLDADGKPEFLPPPNVGRPPDWIRHRCRRA
jgi:hypothetical protein